MDLAKSGGHSFRPTLILVGTRLGIDKITPVYWEALLSALQMPQSVGIAGYAGFHSQSLVEANQEIVAGLHLRITLSGLKAYFSFTLIHIILGQHCRGTRTRTSILRQT